MNLSLYWSIYDFFSNWLFSRELTGDTLFSINGTLLNFELYDTTLIHIITIIFVALMLFTAFWVVKWCINFIMGLSGRYE